MPNEERRIPQPHKGPIAGVTGTVIVGRFLTCQECGREMEVAAVMTDSGAVAIVTEHEADIERSH